MSVEDDVTQAILRLEANETTRRTWPHDFVLRLAVTLGVTLRLDLTAENLSADTWQLSEALHSYFRVQNARNIVVDGLGGLNYWDKQQGGIRGTQTGALRVHPPIDRVYFDHTGEAVIHDLRRRIHISKTGSRTTVVWNPGPEGARGMDDIPETAWAEMLCVETANAVDNRYPLHPGERHTLSATIHADRTVGSS